jgi:hypothetical protein
VSRLVAGPCLRSFQLMFIDHGAHLMSNNVRKRGRSYAHGG